MIYKKVVNIIVKELNVPENKITLETDLQADLGADSLDAVELIMTLEDEFELSISDEQAQNFRKVKDIVDYIEKHI
ncbi:MAG: acyl carrier protein [Bacilli bacterium]|jgi:acyl carrier protein|nr:acyl carrier protein [Acholeplasmataceae bacterium]